MDEHFMRLALSLARKGMGRTHPNPMVGAVVVKEGRIVSTGYHRGFGLPHAEAVALERAGERARGATLYVNLEPCCHQGKTPPCCQAIWRAGIRRVVVAVQDPNPRVNGRGIEFLRSRGIEVRVGVLAREAEELNRAFLHFHRRGKPWLTGKMALTADGATVWKEKYISSPQALLFAHWLRANHMGIMVGINTVLKDDPLLNIRHPRFKGKKIVKIILDSYLRTPYRARLFTTGDPVLIFTSSPKPFDNPQAEIVRIPGKEGKLSLREVLRQLAEREIISVLVEGGPSLMGSLADEGLLNELYLVHSPKIGGKRRLEISPTSVDLKKHWCSSQGEHYIQFSFKEEKNAL